MEWEASFWRSGDDDRDVSLHRSLARWLEAHGTIEFGYSRESRSFVRVLDEGGMIWSGRRSYMTFDAALADCEKGVGRWLREPLEEEI